MNLSILPAHVSASGSVFCILEASLGYICILILFPCIYICCRNSTCHCSGPCFLNKC